MAIPNSTKDISKLGGEEGFRQKYETTRSISNLITPKEPQSIS